MKQTDWTVDMCYVRCKICNIGKDKKSFSNKYIRICRDCMKKKNKNYII